jgi:photosystem II stability/assembly factor-like uncharacterized protein
VKQSIYLLLSFLSICSLQAPWEDRRGNLPSGWGVAWAMDACDMNTAVVALRTGIWQTTDAGHSWQSLGYPTSLYNLPSDVAMPDKYHIWVASDSGKIDFWLAANGTWHEQYHDTSVTTFMNYIEMFDTLNGIAMGDAKGSGLPAVFLHTSDGGAHLTSVNDSSFGYFSGDLWRRLDFIRSSTGYFFESGQAPQRIYKTTDVCAHWTALPLPAPFTYRFSSGTMIALVW